MKKYKIIKEFQCAVGKLFPVDTIVMMELEQNSEFCKFGEISEVESGTPMTVITGLENFLNHVQSIQ